MKIQIIIFKINTGMDVVAGKKMCLQFISTCTVRSHKLRDTEIMGEIP